MNKGIVILIILSIGFIAYWFWIKPAQIRKECYQYAYGTPNNGDTNEWVTATNYYYNACLHRNGLEK